MKSIAKRALVSTGLLLASLPTCRPAETGPPTRIERPAALGLADASALVPAAGLKWAIVLRPRAIFERAELALPLSKIITPDRMKRLQQTYGVGSPSSVKELVYAQYDEASVVVVVTPVQPARVEQSVAAISAIEGRVVDRKIDPAGRITRFWGNVGTDRQQWALLGQEGVAVETGRFGRLRAVTAFATDRLKKTKPLGKTPEVVRARASDPSSELVFYARPPLDPPWNEVGGGVLKTATFVSVSATLGDPADRPNVNLRLRARAWGPWGDRNVEARDRIEAVWDRLASSRLGRLLGLDRPLVPLEATSDAEVLTFSITLEAARLAKGLFWATGASTEEIFAPG